MSTCGSCAEMVPENAAFCPHCGQPLSKTAELSKDPLTSDVATVEIVFGHSTSPNFDRALELVRDRPTYSSEGDGRSKLHKVALPITEVEFLIEVYDLVGSWKSSRMLINGRPAKKSSLIYHAVGCYRERQKAFRIDQYCYGERQHEQNIWGCKRLNMPLVDWPGSWLEYGKFDGKGVWHFDKARIQHELEVRIHENELCPVLNRQRVLATLERLPNTVDPRSDRNWEYVTDYKEIDGSVKQIATGIRPVIEKAPGFVVGDFRPSWRAEEAAVVRTIEATVRSSGTAEATVNRGKSRPRSGCMGIVFLAALVVCLVLLNIDALIEYGGLLLG